MTALIVEGDPLVRRILRETLSARFPLMKVGEAANAAAGRRAAKLHPPSLAFVDLDLPDGLPLVEQIRRRAPFSTIAVWLPGDRPTDLAAAKGSGATHLLVRTEAGIDDITRLAEVAIRREELARQEEGAPTRSSDSTGRERG